MKTLLLLLLPLSLFGTGELKLALSNGTLAPEATLTLDTTPASATFTLTADGRWRHARLDLSVLRQTYPQLKYLKRFRFRTDGNGKKGDFFQLDNFRIEPK